MNEDIQLTPVETRVLGCLIEKESTTPDAYPLSLNALRLACNQKSNRDPVLALDESAVQDAVDLLVRKTLVRSASSAGSRVTRYGHRLTDRLNPEFSFEKDELAIMALLFLRGPQTRGEIRTRSTRLHPFADTTAVAKVLTKLAEREDGPYVTELPPAPGQKEPRYTHLLCGDVEFVSPSAPLPAAGQSRLAELEAEIAALTQRVEALEQKHKPRPFD